MAASGCGAGSGRGGESGKPHSHLQGARRSAARPPHPLPFPAAGVPPPSARSSPSPPDTPPRASATPPGPAPCVTSAVAPPVTTRGGGWGGARTLCACAAVQPARRGPRSCCFRVCTARLSPRGCLLTLHTRRCFEFVPRDTRQTVQPGMGGSMAPSGAQPGTPPRRALSSEAPGLCSAMSLRPRLPVCSQNVLPSEHLPPPRSVPSPGRDP